MLFDTVIMYLSDAVQIQSCIQNWVKQTQSKINFFAKKVSRQVLNTSLEEERWYLHCMVTYHFPPRSQDNNYRLYCTFWWRWGLQNVKSFQVPCFSPKKVKNRSSWFPPTVKTRTYSKLDRLAENVQLLGKDSLL